MGSRYASIYRELQRVVAAESTEVCICLVDIPPIRERIGVEPPDEEPEEVCEECGGVRCTAVVPYYTIEQRSKVKEADETQP
jgi:hypothetical protein